MKKFIILACSIVFVVGCSVGVVLLVNNDNQKNSSQSSTVIQSSSSSQGLIDEEITFLERDDVGPILTQNYENVSLKDFYLLTQGDPEILRGLMKDVYLGDVALTLLGDLFTIGYATDGNWYLTGTTENPIKFNSVMNALFNYQIGAGPLDLNEMELTIYGETKVISFLEQQLNMNFSQFIPTILPSGISSFISRTFDITVNELYAITSGDYTYIVDFINETNVDDLSKLLFDVVDLVNADYDFDGLREVLVDLFDGKITQPVINKTVKVNDILDAFLESLENFVQVSDQIYVAFDELNGLYRGVTVETFYTETLNIDIDEIVESICNTLVEGATDANKAEIELWNDLLQDVLQGTLENVAFAENADFQPILSTLISYINSELNSDKIASDVINVVQKTQDFINTIKQTTEHIKTVIKDYIYSICPIDETNTDAVAFVEAFSTAIANEYDGEEGSMQAFMQEYEQTTLATIDGYLGGKVVEILRYFNLDESILDKKLVDIKNDYDSAQNDYQEFIQNPTEFAQSFNTNYLSDLLAEYGNHSLALIDQELFNGVLNELLVALGISEVTINDIASDFEAFFVKQSEDLANLIQKIKQEFSYENITAQIKEFANECLNDYKEVKIGDLFGEIESLQWLSQITIGDLTELVKTLIDGEISAEILSLTLYDFDKKYLGGALDLLLYRVDMYELIDLTIQDYVDIFNGEASVNALETLDLITIKDINKLIDYLNERIA